ncbi:hypothetical protein [Nocardia tengchongensis]
MLGVELGGQDRGAVGDLGGDREDVIVDPEGQFGAADQPAGHVLDLEDAVLDGQRTGVGPDGHRLVGGGGGVVDGGLLRVRGGRGGDGQCGGEHGRRSGFPHRFSFFSGGDGGI